jgi:hypothetical protein
MSIGVDSQACEQLDTFLERHSTNNMASFFLGVVCQTKPASRHTVQVLVELLGSSSTELQSAAAIHWAVWA